MALRVSFVLAINTGNDHGKDKNAWFEVRVAL
jgi:hypothetical protein